MSISSRPGATKRTRRLASAPLAVPRRAPRCRNPGGPIRPSASGTPQHARAAVEERQVEPVQVVVLDDVRIGRLHLRDQPADQFGLGRIAFAALPPASRSHPAGSRTAIMKMRSRAGSSPVVSRSNCIRRSWSKERSRK